MEQSRGKYLVKNTAIFAVGNAATKLLTFFLVPLYTNVLSEAEYGTMDLIYTICTVLASVIILNINESVIRFSLDPNANHYKIIRIGVLLYVFGILIGLFMIPVMMLFRQTAELSIYAYLYVVTFAGSQLFLCYLRGKEKLIEYTAGNVLNTFLIAGFSILFLTGLNLGIKGYFLAYILGAAITMVYAMFVGRVWQAMVRFSVDAGLARQMIRYSVVFIPNTFMWWIMNSSDRIMVTGMVSAAANGIYAVSYKLPTIVTTTTSIFNQAWSYSAIREVGAADEAEYNNRIFKKLISIVMMLGIGILTFSKPFLRVYVGEGYYSAWKYIPYLTIGCVYLTLSTFIATSYTVHKDSFGYLLSAMLGTALNIVLNFILIPKIAVHGAAFATCVSYLSIFLFRILHTRKYIVFNVNNREFIIGTFILSAVAGLMYVDSAFGIGLQIVLFLVAVRLYTFAWVPAIRTVVNRFCQNREQTDKR